MYPGLFGRLRVPANSALFMWVSEWVACLQLDYVCSSWSFRNESLCFWLHVLRKPPGTEITNETLIKIFQNYHMFSESALSSKRFLCNLLHSVPSLAREPSLIGLKREERREKGEDSLVSFLVKQPTYLGFPILGGSRLNGVHWEILFLISFKTLWKSIKISERKKKRWRKEKKKSHGIRPSLCPYEESFQIIHDQLEHLPHLLHTPFKLA